MCITYGVIKPLIGVKNTFTHGGAIDYPELPKELDASFTKLTEKEIDILLEAKKKINLYSKKITRIRKARFDKRVSNIYRFFNFKRYRKPL
jgi:hypothetical protein